MGELRSQDLVKLQMKTISQLQDKINLLQFDINDNLNEIRRLKQRENYRKETIIKVKEELLNMSKNNDYSRISYVLKLLKVENRNDEQE